MCHTSEMAHALCWPGAQMIKWRSREVAHVILVAMYPNDYLPYMSHILTCHMLAKCHTREVAPADPVGRCQSSRLVQAEAAIDLLHSKT